MKSRGTEGHVKREIGDRWPRVINARSQQKLEEASGFSTGASGLVAFGTGSYGSPRKLIQDPPAKES